LSPGYLAMECLLVLTSRRSGDWFKEELREVGALHHIASSIVGGCMIQRVGALHHIASSIVGGCHKFYFVNCYSIYHSLLLLSLQL